VGKAKTTPETLKRTRDILATVQAGLSLIHNATDPQQRMSGVRNVIVFGRAITNVLQNLRASESGFDAWYAPHRQKLQNNSEARYLYELRTRILKEGDMPTYSSVTINGSSSGLARQFPNPPPHAKSFFVGDRIGGSGWIVELPNGEEEKFYVNLPSEMPGLSINCQVHFADGPPELREAPLHEICARYVQLLAGMVADAESTFVKKAKTTE
jgi:hypothetical protein